MTRVRRQQEAEWQFKQEMRDKREARLRQEQANDARLRRWLELTRHQDAIHCDCCGRPSSGPWIEPAVDELARPARVDWDDSANLLRCMVCGGWLCLSCIVYVPGAGRRCANAAACDGP